MTSFHSGRGNGWEEPAAALDGARAWRTEEFNLLGCVLACVGRSDGRRRLVVYWALVLVPVPLLTWLGYVWSDPLAGILISAVFVVVLAWSLWHFYGYFPNRDEFVNGPDESEL